MKVALTQRWGQHKPGHTVEVNPTMGAWLVQHRLGVEVRPAQSTPVAEPAPAEEPAPTRRAYRRSTEADTGTQDEASTPDATPTQVEADEAAPKRRTRRKPSSTDS